eukprot:4317185-Prymnesium_polylepis.2
MHAADAPREHGDRARVKEAARAAIVLGALDVNVHEIHHTRQPLLSEQLAQRQRGCREIALIARSSSMSSSRRRPAGLPHSLVDSGIVARRSSVGSCELAVNGGGRHEARSEVHRTPRHGVELREAFDRPLERA